MIPGRARPLEDLREVQRDDFIAFLRRWTACP